MNLLNARHVLHKVATESRTATEQVNKQEIVSKINQIKYLSKQKNMSPSTIHKQIEHLEDKMKGVFSLQEQLRRHKRQERSKITALKKQLHAMQNRLDMGESKDVHHKVEHLSNVLGDYMAKKSVSEDLVKRQKIAKLNALLAKLQQSLDQSTADPAKVALIRSRLSSLQEKIVEIQQSKQPSKNNSSDQQGVEPISSPSLNPQPDSQNQDSSLISIPDQTPSGVEDVNHTLILTGPNQQAQQPLEPQLESIVQETSQQEELDIAKELPLPPPPRVVN